MSGATITPADETPSEALARELGPYGGSDLGLAVLRYVREWEDTKNPHWIDLAVVVVTMAGQPIPPCLQEMAAYVAQRRINGLEDAAGGPSVIKKEIKGLGFACMAFLIARGFTVGEASVHAANAVAAVFGAGFCKASTFEKEYGKTRASQYSHWEDLCRNLNAEEPAMGERLWSELQNIPMLDPGNRRQ